MCVSVGIPQPADVFPKVDYRGIIWAKCTSLSQRDVLITKIRNTVGEAEKKPWAKIDLPIDKRTAESALFAFKRMLVEWGYANKAIRVDTDLCVLKVLDKEILKAKVEDFSLKLQEVRQNRSGGSRRPLVGFGMGKVEVFFVLATSKSKSRGGGLVTFLSVYICTAKRTSSTSMFFFLA